MSAPVSSTGGPAVVMPRAGLALALLTSINLFNYIDRQVLSAVLPRLELDATLFRPDDPWLKSKLGLLTTAFLVSYMLISPIFGRLGDRFSRWWLVAFGVIVWSLASGGSGLATSFAMLLITRCIVGIGEAAYGPVAPSMLSDMYPESIRGKVMSWFYLAIPVGSALGFVVGGMVADTAWGWPGAFQVVVLPGLILGSLCLLMKEPPRPKLSADHVRESWGSILRELKGIRSFVMCCAGMTCTTFVLGGVAAWTPYYIFEREARFEIAGKKLEEVGAKTVSDGTPLVPQAVIAKLKALEGSAVLDSKELKTTLLNGGLSADELSQYQSRIVDAVVAEDSISLGKIDFTFGVIVVVGGLLATLFGGWLGDKLREKIPGAYFQVCGYGALLGFPAFLMMIFMPFPWAWIGVFLAVFWLFVNTGPANAILANVTRPSIRASAFAVNILIIHLFGDAISPPLIGFIADHSSLTVALLGSSSLILLGGVLWIAGARSLDAETKAVSDGEALAKMAGK